MLRPGVGRELAAGQMEEGGWLETCRTEQSSSEGPLAPPVSKWKQLQSCICIANLSLLFRLYVYWDCLGVSYVIGLAAVPDRP